MRALVGTAFAVTVGTVIVLWLRDSPETGLDWLAPVVAIALNSATVK